MFSTMPRNNQLAVVFTHSLNLRDELQGWAAKEKDKKKRKGKQSLAAIAAIRRFLELPEQEREAMIQTERIIAKKEELAELSTNQRPQPIEPSAKKEMVKSVRARRSTAKERQEDPPKGAAG